MHHDKRRVSSLASCSWYASVFVGKDAGSFPFIVKHDAGTGYVRNERMDDGRHDLRPCSVWTNCSNLANAVLHE